MARPNKNIDPRQEERLRIVIEEQGISQNKLADVCGVSRQSMSRYINCRDQLQDYVALSIANAYGYNPAWLLCIDDRKKDTKDFVREMEEKDEAFAAFMILLEDAAKDMNVSILARQRKQFPIDGVTQDIIKNAPMHVAPSFYDFSLMQKGKTVSMFSGLELKKLQKRLTRYAKLLIEEMIEEGETDNGEH